MKGRDVEFAIAHDKYFSPTLSAETSLAGRTGLYDITVTNQRGELIAVFRGRSHRLGERQVFEEGNA